MGLAGDEDLHSTPQYFSPGAMKEGESIRTPGVEIHANAIATLLAGDRLRTLSSVQQHGVTLLLVFAVSFCCLRFSPVPALISSAILIVAFLGFSSSVAFGHGLWVLLVPPVTGAIVAIGAAEIANYMIEGREKRQLRNIFKRYVNDDVIEKILESPRDLILKGERKRITVLFADIRDFTTRAEKAPAEALVKNLNEYFTAMVTVVQDHNGMVDKFIGDGLMALFGVPIDDPEAALHAVQAARAMLGALQNVNREFEKKGIAPIGIGIGIHTGEAVVGNVGSVRKMEYTAIGDVVNVAARIEGLTRKLDRDLLISADTFGALQGQIAAEPLGEEAVKGRFRPISVYGVGS
jgi:adenylate cyclase